MNVLIIGGNRFVGHQLAFRMVAAGHGVTLLNRGTLPDDLGGGVERLHADRTTAEFERVLAGRSFDAAVDFAAFTGDDTRRAADVLDGRCGHYVMISSGQVYLVRDSRPPGAFRESDYGGPLMARPADPRDAKEWDYGMGKRDAAGLDPVQVSPFSGRWMSFLDSARARDDFGLRHDPLRHYLDKIVSDFFNHPRTAPPPGYASRAAELALLGGLG
jgi:hypothetical protein